MTLYVIPAVTLFMIWSMTAMVAAHAKKSYLVPHFDFFHVCQVSFSQTLIVFFS
jgi:hypothetical protein